VLAWEMLNCQSFSLLMLTKYYEVLLFSPCPSANCRIKRKEKEREKERKKQNKTKQKNVKSTVTEICIILMGLDVGDRRKATQYELKPVE